MTTQNERDWRTGAFGPNLPEWYQKIYQGDLAEELDKLDSQHMFNMAVAMLATRGNVTRAISALEAANIPGPSRATHYNWLEKADEDAENYPQCVQYAECINLSNAKLGDLLEAASEDLALGAQVVAPDGKTYYKEKPDGPQLRFILRTKFKDRGYQESVDNTTGGQSFNTVYEPALFNGKTPAAGGGDDGDSEE